MDWQMLPIIDDAAVYVDVAFLKARKRQNQLAKKRSEDPVYYKKRVGIERIGTVRKYIVKRFDTIIGKYPNFDNLSDFYEELISSLLTIDEIKNYLGRIQGCKKEIMRFSQSVVQKIKRCESESAVEKELNAYYGRVSSLIHRISDALEYMQNARRKLITLPVIKEFFTVALAGFPNVGKSTLLSEITTARPKIASYSFTTKSLNLGYYKHKFQTIQVVDTPGTLARYEKMNAIEKQAYLCLKYVADAIIMVVDPTFSFEDQLRLYDEIKGHDKKIFVYVSKEDIATDEQISIVKEHFGEHVIAKTDIKSVIFSLL